MIKFQRGSDDCVATCVEFILNKDYQEVLNEIGYSTDKNTLVEYLNKNNIITKEIITKAGHKEFMGVDSDNDFNDYKNITAFATVKLYSSYHCVIIKDNKIYDPLTASSYPINKEKILYLITI
jgi:hypothetical protein